MKTYQVVHRDDGCWAVVKEGAMRAASVHDTEADAIAAAEALLKTHPGYFLVVEGREQTVVREPSAGYKPAVGAGKAVSDFNLLFGERLQRARIMRGYSLRGLADALEGEYSHTQLQKIEKGLAKTDTRFLARVSRVLKVRSDYFMRQSGLSFQSVEYRSLTKVGKKQRERLKEESFEFFERYLEVESFLNIKNPAFSQVDLRSMAPEALGKAVEQAAVDTRTRWDLGMNPIPNVHSMLEEHGVKVKLFRNALKGFDGLSAFVGTETAKIPVMALSWIEDVPRLRLTALHELAHLRLVFPESLEAREIEKLCHRFAGAFLLPEEPFKRFFGEKRSKVSIPELVAIKQEWGIPCSAIMARAHNAGVVTDGFYRYFCIKANQLKWKTEGEPGRNVWKGTEESARFTQLVHRALSQQLISISKASGLLGCPVEELMYGELSED